jgi:formylglycine-generating enzyme required for sulfatase activity
MNAISRKNVFNPGFALIFLVMLCTAPATGFAMDKKFKNSLEMEFVLIPAGTFVMGSPPGETSRSRNEAQHSVTITKPFYMQTTEVSLKQWWDVMGKKFCGRRKGYKDGPVAKVSWFDCIKFIEKLNEKGQGVYRLATEAEWEYACRAGTQTTYSWGNKIDCTKAMFANNTKREQRGTCVDFIKSKGLKPNRAAPSRTYAPNAWGIYDMHGNVWEWCQDWYQSDYPKGPVTDPKGPDSSEKGKIRRGGSWFGKGSLCRSANRTYANPASRFETTGFRLVMVAQ